MPPPPEQAPPPFFGPSLATMPAKRDPDGRGGGRGSKRAKADQTVLEVSLAEGSLQKWGKSVFAECDEVLMKEEKFSSVSDYIRDYIFSDSGVG